MKYNHEDVVGEHDVVACFGIASSRPGKLCPVGWKVDSY